MQYKKAYDACLTKSMTASCPCRGDQARWQQIAKRNMQEDNSWEKSAGEYVQLYNNILKE